ncbi:MAG: hypothetical protein HKP61_08305 [Dactylosporangium sp.]|nr:hypothetical protein [Dactylosporangium sp.]NNJ60939.1 hypothetical protein [Dactylosporangium sp.]
MRVLNRLTLVLLAIALLAGGLLVAVEGALAAAGRPGLVPRESWYRTLTTTEVGDRWPLGVALGLGVLGLLIVGAQVRPWIPDRLAIMIDGWQVQRRSAERHLADAIAQVTAVTNVRATLRGRGRRWRLRIRAAADADSRPAVAEALDRALLRLSAPIVRRPRIRLVRRRVT